MRRRNTREKIVYGHKKLGETRKSSNPTEDKDAELNDNVNSFAFIVPPLTSTKTISFLYIFA